MKDKTKQILTNMATRLQFYLESIRAFSPVKLLTEDQLRSTNDFGQGNAIIIVVNPKTPNNMTRKEYLNQKTDGAVPVSDTIKDLSEYFKIRKQCDQFERQNITEFLTEDDYKAFDANFNRCLESLQYKDPDDEDAKSDIEKVREMMELTDWKWAYSSENGEAAVPSEKQIIECIRYCYEKSLESGHARISCSTGGINVETDILDHLVHITFEQFEISHYDGEE